LLVVAVVAAAVMVFGAPDGPSPAGAATRRVALWGTSISNDADARLVARVGARFSYYGHTVDSSVITDHFSDVSARLAGSSRPDQAIFELGTGDASRGRSAAEMRSDIRNMLTRTRNLDCVRWLNVKEFGVNGIYAGVVANADRFNQVLREVRASGEFPNFRVVDYNLWAYFNQGAFSADGLHFNAAGEDMYARLIADEVAGCPGSPTTTTTTRPTTTTTRPTTTTTRPTTTTTRPTTTTTTQPGYSGAFTVAMTGDPVAHAGGLVMYQVRVSNTGSSTIPAATAASSTVPTCTRQLPSVPGRSTFSYSCSLRTVAGDAGRTIRNTVRVTNGPYARSSSEVATSVAAGGECRGRLPSVYLGDGDAPTFTDDVIVGTGGPDLIQGQAGNDVICGFGGNDVIYGDDGDDGIYGGDGDDELRGGLGTDVCDGGPDRDYAGSSCETRVNIP